MKNTRQEAAFKKLHDAALAAEKKVARKKTKKAAVFLTQEETIELILSAQDRFFDFCRLKAPDFYRPERTFLVELCDELQRFIETDEHDILILNLPPRHGKSRTVGLLVQWVFGQNPSEKIMTGSYNEILSTVFSTTVRDSIQEDKFDPTRIVYSDIFPDVKIKDGDGAAQRWTLAGEYSSYLATSPTGTATGFGCSLMIIDDIIKNALEANNEIHLEKLWSWFVDTMLQRLEEGGKIIIIMTRWASLDLAGRAIAHYGDRAKVIIKKALQPDGSMLCPEILSRKSYDNKASAMSPEIAAAIFQQEPIDSKDRLYKSFKTYDQLPADAAGSSLLEIIRNYTDTADDGSDYLCSIVYGVYNMEAYVLDILYTRASMQETEPQTAKMLYEHKVNEADIESNNGGKGFARNVERHLKEDYKTNRTVIHWFFQSQNKKSRILSGASWIEEHLYFPKNWYLRWPEYYKAMMKYQREGKNKNDDAPDATTGIYETITGGPGVSEFVDVQM